MDNKTDLRIKAKDIRKTLDMVTVSELLTKYIRGTEIYKKAKNIMIFYPMECEVNMLELLNDNKQFFLPKVDGKCLLVCPFSKGEELKKSSYNINEPCSTPENPEILDLIFVPALAVDKNNNRLGYGGGFYDRFLVGYPNADTVVPIAKELYFDDIPVEEFDIRIDHVFKI